MESENITIRTCKSLQDLPVRIQLRAIGAQTIRPGNVGHRASKLVRKRNTIRKTPPKKRLTAKTTTALLDELNRAGMKLSIRRRTKTTRTRSATRRNRSEGKKTSMGKDFTHGRKGKIRQRPTPGVTSHSIEKKKGVTLEERSELEVARVMKTLKILRDL